MPTSSTATRTESTKQAVATIPHFKPDWNPELFYGQNLISHLGVYRTALVRSVGGFREGFEGSQDYDLALRVVEHSQPDRIRHIPHVLYHWRAIPGSTSLGVDEKSYAPRRRAPRRPGALRARRLHASCGPAPNVPYHQRIRYSLPSPRPHVTIIIPTRDRVDFPEPVRGQRRVALHLQGVRPRDRGQRQHRGRVEVLLRAGAAGSVRLGASRSTGRSTSRGSTIWRRPRARRRFCAFLNNDTEVISPDWLEEMVSLAVRDGRRRRRRDALLSRRHHPARGRGPRDGRDRLPCAPGLAAGRCRATSAGRRSRRRCPP